MRYSIGPHRCSDTLGSTTQVVAYVTLGLELVSIFANGSFQQVATPRAGGATHETPTTAARVLVPIHLWSDHVFGSSCAIPWTW